MNSKKHRVFRIFSHRGIDFRLWLWYIHTITKAVTKTSVSGKIPREGATWCEAAVPLPKTIPLPSCREEIPGRVRPLKRQ